MKKILKYIYNKYPEFFQNEVKKEFTEKNQTDLIRANLEDLYEKNKHFFELLLVRDFVGYIPKDINEPTLKIFEEYGDIFEKWIMWHSWYINRKAMNDPMKIPFYSGMMVYLKVLFTISSTNKKNKTPDIKPEDTKVDKKKSSIEEALEGISQFKIGVEKLKQNESDKSDEDAEN